MTTARIGAAPHEEVRWDAIDWHKAERTVGRLQARIVKATKDSRWNKVRALQRLLTCSWSGRVIAVKRVTENKGKKTSGVDGIIWTTPEEKNDATQSLKRRGYHPQPLRRVYIPKSNGKRRPLGIPTMRDRAMQTLYLLALDPLAETTGDPNSYGFRRGRSTADAVQQCFNVFRWRTTSWVLEGDIQGCFDNISHDWLLSHIPMDKEMLRKWLKSGYMEDGQFYDTESGTPQGGSISPALANLALDGLERRLQQRFPRKGQGSKKGRAAKVNLIRYADDFVISGDNKKLLENEVMPIIESFLRDRGLTLSPEKTAITHIDQGFDFLGQNIRRYQEKKLLIKPSKKSYQGLITEVRSVIREHLGLPTHVLIAKLNPLIRGWVEYHKHIVAKKVFNRIDHEIVLLLLRWARRRHPRKNAGWLKRKYFTRCGNRDWFFFADTKRADGSKNRYHLISAVKTPIRRHVKVLCTANPYDPAYRAYFAERTAKRIRQGNRNRVSYRASEPRRCERLEPCEVETLMHGS